MDFDVKKFINDEFGDEQRYTLVPCNDHLWLLRFDNQMDFWIIQGLQGSFILEDIFSAQHKINEVTINLEKIPQDYLLP